MSFRELLAWAWRKTPPVHANSANLIIHLFAVSIFVSGHALLLAAVGVTWWLAIAAFLCIVVSLALQAYGHSRCNASLKSSP